MSLNFGSRLKPVIKVTAAAGFFLRFSGHLQGTVLKVKTVQWRLISLTFGYCGSDRPPSDWRWVQL